MPAGALAADAAAGRAFPAGKAALAAGRDGQIVIGLHQRVVAGSLDPRVAAGAVAGVDAAVIGRAAPAVGVGRRTIPTDHLDLWVRLEPGGEGACGAIRKQIDNLVAL